MVCAVLILTAFCDWQGIIALCVNISIDVCDVDRLSLVDFVYLPFENLAGITLY
jgi:hypothetical protein